LSLGFLVWIITFAVTQKYLSEIGRYFSVAVLAGSPAVAIIIDFAIKNSAFAFLRRSIVLAAASMTVIMAIMVLSDNAHRPLGRALSSDSRYVIGFSPEARAVVKSATAVNVRPAYGVDTYDYYMLMDRGAKLTNLAAIQPHALNLVIVRPAGLIDNVYSDPRIPVRMKRPFAGSFAYLGHAIPQPGYEYNFLFANNAETTAHSDLGAKSEFLLFQPNISLENFSIVGSMQQITNPETASKVHFRIGWREPSGELVMDEIWHQEKLAKFRIPERALMIVLQVTFDDSDNEGLTEWPIRNFDPVSAATLNLIYKHEQ
jgi:hypothetical protein